MEALGLAPMPSLDEAIRDYLKARAQKLNVSPTLRPYSAAPPPASSST